MKQPSRAKRSTRSKGSLRIAPAESYRRIRIPDATPWIVAKYARDDTQALLARVRYNRLIDVFLGVTAYSLQNHFRVSVRKMGRIEVGELYVAVSNTGQQFVIPVQAQGGNDQIAVVQVMQDLAMCRATYPQLTARPVAVQFVHDGDQEVIVMFELMHDSEEVRIVDERHYRLAPASEISEVDLETARRSGA